MPPIQQSAAAPQPPVPQVVPQAVPMPAHSGVSAVLAVVITIIILLAALGGAWYADLISFASAQPEAAPQTTTEETALVVPSTISVGTYALIGKGAGQAENYSGTITIAKRGTTANVYDLVWRITSGQTQSGVGILTNGVLSVSYYEASGNTLADIGVVSYRVIDDSHLSGEWTSVQGGSAGEEQLSLQPQL